MIAARERGSRFSFHSCKGEKLWLTQMLHLIPPGISRWWRVVGGVSMNLALGSLYAWSVFVAPLEKEFHWKRADTSNVFIIAVVVFALTFIVAGRLQDKLGPFKISIIGAILVSLGFFLCSYADSLTQILHLLRRPRRVGQRFWLRDSDSRHVQVVSGQAWPGGRAGGGRIRRRIGNLWAAGGKLPDSAPMAGAPPFRSWAGSSL